MELGSKNPNISETTTNYVNENPTAQNNIQDNKSISKKISNLVSSLLLGINSCFSYLDTGILSVFGARKITAYYHTSWKSDLTDPKNASKVKRNTFFSSLYDGADFFNTARTRLRCAENAALAEGCQTMSPEEKEELANIIKNRQIFSKMVHLSGSSNRLVDEILKSIKEFDSPDSKRVVQVKRRENGKEIDYQSFSIPGGCFQHATSYEFRKENNDYFLIIHNKGSGLEDDNIHGPVEQSFDSENRPIYSKTSVYIKVDKDALMDEKFLKKLVKSSYSLSMSRGGYKVIKENLIKTQKGNIETISGEEQYSKLKKEYSKINAKCKDLRIEYTQLEKSSPQNKILLERKKKEREALRLQLEDLHSQMLTAFDEIVKNDKRNCYHSIQNYGTCTASCLTGAEKNMASVQTRRKLKLATIQIMTNEVKNAIYVNPIARKEILKHSEFRIQELNTRIAQNAKNKKERQIKVQPQLNITAEQEFLKRREESEKQKNQQTG